MKTSVVLLALVAATQTAHAQYIRSETAGGALLGGIAGAIIGNNSGDLGHNSLRGAAIGTVAGALIGSAVGNSRDKYYSHDVPMPTYRSSYGRDYGYYSPSVSRYRSPTYFTDYSYREPGYYGSSYRPYYSERTRASTGLVLGGIAGAVIGNNSGDLRHNAWRGAAIGATSGWLLGAIADQRARDRQREVVFIDSSEETAPAAPAAPAQTVPQTVIINNNYYGPQSSMTSANSLFGR
jgi:uncharacterized protein YcfJ